MRPAGRSIRPAAIQLHRLTGSHQRLIPATPTKRPYGLFNDIAQVRGVGLREASAHGSSTAGGLQRLICSPTSDKGRQVTFNDVPGSGCRPAGNLSQRSAQRPASRAATNASFRSPHSDKRFARLFNDIARFGCGRPCRKPQPALIQLHRLTSRHQRLILCFPTADKMFARLVGSRSGCRPAGKPQPALAQAHHLAGRLQRLVPLSPLPRNASLGYSTTQPGRGSGLREASASPIQPTPRRPH